MSRKRDLDEDERALWRKVADSVNAYARPVSPPAASVLPAKAEAPDAGTVEKAARAVAPPPPPPPKPAAAAPRRHGEAPSVDRRTATRLKRGRTRPQAELDLHGHNRETGRRAVVGFVESAHARGLRCVRIVTGKGGEGVLRKALPGWLNEPPLGPIVLMFDHAPQAEGGLGAVHVLIRRAREGGP